MARKRAPYRRTAEALAELLDRSQPGEALPSEPRLAEQLGVSRATLREAMRAFQERGLLVRRQGVGTYVGPNRIEAGLEELVSLDTLAAQAGLALTVEGLRVQRRPPSRREAKALGLGGEQAVLEIRRQIRAEGRVVAFLIDVVPDGLIAEQAFRERFRGSVLDLLLEQGEPALEASRTEIHALAADPELAAQMQVSEGEALLMLEASLLTRQGTVVDRSRSYFLPGTFRFQVVRRIGIPGGASRLQPGQEASER